MATFNKIEQFAEDVYEKIHDLGADTLKLVLTNTPPDLANDGQFSDLTEIAAGNGYPAGGPTVTITGSSQVAGLYSLVGTDVVITAGGGPIGPFQYVYLYNSTAAGQELIGQWSAAAPITLADLETFTVDFAAAILTHG